MDKELILQSSPLQGYTDAIYRKTHQKYFAGIDNYYTPFLRIERGDYRSKDLKDIHPDNNNEGIIPQLLPGDSEELKRMTDTLLALGWRECDLNFGCPFPMLVKRGKGAGMLKNLSVLEKIVEQIQNTKELNFSIKMRLGFNELGEGIEALDMFNSIELKYIICHSRLGIDKYTSALRLDEFEQFYKKSRHPLIYNGNVNSLEFAQMLKQRFPALIGYALGRGLLQRPWLAKELKTGKQLSTPYTLIKQFHDELQAQYSNKLEGGDHQILNKLKTIWDYLLVDENPKAVKKIKKASSLAKYNQEVSNLFAPY